MMANGWCILTSGGTCKDGLRIAVSVVTLSMCRLNGRLQQLGFEDIVPFYDLAESFRGVHPLSNGWFAHRCLR